MSCFKPELEYYKFSELSSAVFFCGLKYCGCSITKKKKKKSTVSNFLKECRKDQSLLFFLAVLKYSCAAP